MRRTTIGVIGNAARPGRDLPAHVLEVAEGVGTEVAAAGCVLLSGGTGGVMEAACRGAAGAGGLTIGFLPQADYEHANPYVQVALPTGLGTLRNVLTARCADAVIMIGGGVGTLNEVTVAYDSGTPVVAVRGTGGWADRLGDALLDGQWLDERRVVAISFADTAAEAVALATDRAGLPRTRGGLTAFTGAAGQ